MISKILILILFICCSFSETITESRETAITRAVNKVGPAIASINIEQHISSFSFDPFFGIGFPRDIIPMKSSGSGVVISPDGYVMTNQHVIAGADRITVTLTGGNEYDAQLVGSDETSDLALLKLKGNNFPYAKLGDSDDLIIGEWIIALGNPFQLFSVSNKPSASVGIVSATHMDFGHQKESGRVFQDMIQTDAAINPGNSGGPLVNALGEVIGISTFIFTGSNHAQGSIGIGFAIPINTAKRIARELRSKGRVDRTYSTGLVVQPITRNIARYLNIPLSEGVIIVNVADGSAAKKAGIKPGDIITSANDFPVTNPSDIRELILEKDLRSGDILVLDIFRKGKKMVKKMKLGKYNTN